MLGGEAERAVGREAPSCASSHSSKTGASYCKENLGLGLLLSRKRAGTSTTLFLVLPDSLTMR